MIPRKSEFISKPYQKPYTTGPISTEIYKTDLTDLNNAMISIINSNNPSEILTFFQSNISTGLKDKDGNSPLHLLISIDNTKMNQSQKIEIINQLIKPPYSLSIDSFNNNIETPLHIAVTNQYDEIIKFLLNNGADANKINGKHQNILHLAVIPHHKPCEKHIKPENVIEQEQASEDKNNIYNEILSIFYNNVKLYKQQIKIIRNNVKFVDQYYQQRKLTTIFVDENNNNTLTFEDTPIDTILKDTQDTLVRNITNPTIKKTELKGNINYQLMIAIEKISEEYEKFIKGGIIKLNLENRENIEINDPDIISKIIRYKKDEKLISSNSCVVQILADIILKIEAKIIDINNDITNKFGLAGVTLLQFNNPNIFKIIYDQFNELLNMVRLINTNQDIDDIKKLNLMLQEYVKLLNIYLSIMYFIGNKNFYNAPPNGDKIFTPFQLISLPIFCIKLIEAEQKYYPLIKENNIEKKVEDIIIGPAINTRVDTKELKFVPNIFTSDICVDYIGDIKKEFVRQFMTKAITPTTDENNILNDIVNKLTTNLTGINELNKDNINIDAMLIMIKMLDNLIIKTIKSEIYNTTLRKIKNIIFNTKNPELFDIASDVFNHILETTNVSIKLNKNINEMVLIQPTNKINEEIKVKNQENIDVLDKEIITNIIENDKNDEPLEIIRSNGSYLVYYSKSYNTLESISSRQCSFNIDKIINVIIQNAKTLDYFKKDVNGFSPIYYAIQSENYLITKILKNQIERILYQFNNYQESPISFAYKILIENLVSPNFSLLNKTFIDSMLQIANIKKSIPKFYRNGYKKIIFNINTLFEKYNELKEIFDVQFIIDSIIKRNITDEQSEQLDKIQIPFNKEQIVSLNKIIKIINNKIINHKSIKSQEIKTKLKNHKQYISDILVIFKNFITVLEQKYKKKVLYKYKSTGEDEGTFGSKPNKMTQLNTEVNIYYLFLIVTGVVFIKYIITDYYVSNIMKIIRTTQIFNFDDLDNNTSKTIEEKLKEYVIKYVKLKIFETIKDFYSIKFDDFDNTINTSQPFEMYFSTLLEEITIELGLDKKIVENIKLYNIYISELVQKTLEYNQIILDISHKWYANLYCSLKTFNELISF